MPPRPPFFQLTRLRPLSRKTTKFHHNHLFLLVLVPVPVRPLSTTPAPRLKAAGVPHRNGFISTTRFTQADIPDLSFWLHHAVPPLVPNGEVAPAQCLEACVRYVQLATEGAHGWQKRRLSATATSPAILADGRIPLFTLHYAAATLLLFGRTRPCYLLSLHILTTAASLGYVPSVLDLAHIGHRTGGLDRPQFEYAREGLARLVAAATTTNSNNNNPNNRSDSGREYRLDVLTLAAMVQLSEPTTRASTDRAVRLLEEAFKTYAAATGATVEGEKEKDTTSTTSTSTPIWERRATAALTLSQLYVDRKQVSRARDLLASVAKELDNPEVYFRWAMLLDESDLRRRVLVQKAAVSGVEAAAREIAREIRESLKVEEGGERLSNWDRKAREVMAHEWAAIAGDEAILEE
ncbi:hypothetical protein F4811DRAFT_203152 [Daldinia bambusicola]|nr:hypothetical protein F4811DRAFT_203152 [Daldinia bambusicola]